MLRYIADKGLDYDITLVYSNRDVESTAFLDELKELESVVPRCRVLFTMTDDPSWEGDKRMLDAEVLGELLGDLESFHFMIAGPPPMAKSVEGSLLEAGLSEDQVQSDSFSGY
jgi:ferredoxin-NADP reductase